MAEFNQDGSIKLPGFVINRNKQNGEKMRSQRCIKLKREVVSFTAPKKCVLCLQLSDRISDTRFVENLYNFFKEKAAVPNGIKKIDERNFEIEIGTHFRRCTECNSLIARYREFLDGNIIDEKGSCTFEGRKTGFSYEDYFD